MIREKSIESFGRYWMFVWRVFSRPERLRVYGKRFVDEVAKLGIDSIPLVIVISIFIGAVITIQMQLNITSPLIPAYSVGLATRDIVLLEFSNSILCLILAGKVGSNIASEIGTMRISQQLDAIDMMGINSASFVARPKILAATVTSPLLTILSIVLGLVGGGLITWLTGMIPLVKYLTGLRYAFNAY